MYGVANYFFLNRAVGLIFSVSAEKVVFSVEKQSILFKLSFSRPFRIPLTCYPAETNTKEQNETRKTLNWLKNCVSNIQLEVVWIILWL